MPSSTTPVTLSTPADSVDRPGCWVQVALDVPLLGLFDYRAPADVQIGQRVIVPFGRRKLVGVVVAMPPQPAFDPSQVKDVHQVLEIGRASCRERVCKYV